MAAIDIKLALSNVNQRIVNAIQKRSQNIQSDIRLVAVSKLKPKNMIIEAYKCGQMTFGENYVQELFEKSNDEEIQVNCPNIKWHFIGHLQKNKVNKLLGVKNLDIIETCYSKEIADAINNALVTKNEIEPLKIMIQVNTSNEDNKNGVEIIAVPSLAEHILKNCSKLKLVGLMTIGSLDNSLQKIPNPDFITLIQCKKELCDKLNLNEDKLEISMGMSNDFEHAIELGSTNVRIGSTIFGERQKH